MAMTPETNLSLSESRRGKPSIVFDAASVALLGKFSDELSAYRTRKKWFDVLHSYFLLEQERDYEMNVECSHDENKYVLTCGFTSACGRYAFWRLINHQAPDAEVKLCHTVATATIGEERVAVIRAHSDRTTVSNERFPWIMTGTSPDTKEKRTGTPKRISAIIDKLLGTLLQSRNHK